MFGVIFWVVIFKVNKLTIEDVLCLDDSVKALYDNVSDNVSAYTFLFYIEYLLF